MQGEKSKAKEIFMANQALSGADAARGVSASDFIKRNGLTIQIASKEELARQADAICDQWEAREKEQKKIKETKESLQSRIVKKEALAATLETEAARLRALETSQRNEAARLRALETSQRNEAARLRALETSQRNEAARLRALETSQRDEAARLRALETSQKDAASKFRQEADEAAQKLVQQQQLLEKHKQKLEADRQQLVCVGVVKVLGLGTKDLPFARSLAKPDQERYFDFYLPPQKQFVIKKAGMDILIQTAKDPANKLLGLKPGDFSICGNSESNIEGLTQFIEAIPDMNVTSVVFSCPLSNDALTALVKVAVAAKGSLNVKLTHQATEILFQAKLTEKPAPLSKPLPTVPQTSKKSPAVLVKASAKPESIEKTGESPPKVYTY